jgi:hypothetical protein
MTKKIALVFLLLVSINAFADDREKIRAAALDYAEGWYTGDAKRMERAVHPDLAKRIAARGGLESMTAQTLVEDTGRGGGRRTPKEKQLADVKILDVFGNAASVRLEMSGWIDYMHLAKFGDEWKIVNVLWEMKKK